MSKILVLTGSVRKHGNTDTLAEAFAEGAKKHHEVEILSVADLNVNPCIGCNSCFERENHACFQDDDMSAIYEKLKETDILIIASPVYFYGVSAQIKAVIDRFHTPMRNEFSIKKLGLILVGAASLPNLFDSIIVQYRMAIDFFHLEDAGMVLARNAKDKGDVLKTDAVIEARGFGERI